MSAAPFRRAGSKPSLFDEAAVARAEGALKALSGHFQGWLEEEVLKVHDARVAARGDNWSDASLDALLAAAHDVKGLGATYDYPFATRAAASLCRLIETAEGKAAARREPHLIEAHVDALRASARDKIRTPEHPVGKALLAALEGRVEELGVAPT